MRKKTRMYWIWTVVVILVLLMGKGWGLQGVVALTAAGTAAASPTAATASDPDLVAFDEQQAANELEAQVIAIYELASPSVVNITNRSYVYYRFMGSVPEEGTGSGFVYDRVVTDPVTLSCAGGMRTTRSSM
jgi:hypothetical protein